MVGRKMVGRKKVDACKSAHVSLGGLCVTGGCGVTFSLYHCMKF